MKRFSELNVDTSLPQNEPTSTTKLPDTLDIVEPDTDASESQPAIPDIPIYMQIDSDFVGYESEHQQYTVYRAAAYATIVTGLESVLDIGCGRGDFGDYVLSRYPNVKYTGFDSNQLMIDIGKLKFSQKYSPFRFNLEQLSFNNTITTEQTYDYVYNINNMSIDYGIWPDISKDDNRYMYFKMMLQKSLDLCNIGTVFMLHSDAYKSTESGILTYELSPISAILHDMNLKFAIDNTDTPEIYKLIVLKKSFNYNT